MLTLSYGFKKPELDDTGNVFFPAMEDNIQQLNDHTHNGVNSAILAPATQSVAAGSWGALDTATGLYSQVVTLPAGYTCDTVVMNFKLSSGAPVYPTLTKTSANTYTIYTNDNGQTYTALYTS